MYKAFKILAIVCATVFLTNCNHQNKFKLTSERGATYLLNEASGELFELNYDNKKLVKYHREYVSNDTIAFKTFDPKVLNSDSLTALLSIKAYPELDETFYRFNIRNNDFSKLSEPNTISKNQDPESKLTLYLIDKHGFELVKKEIYLRSLSRSVGIDGGIGAYNIDGKLNIDPKTLEHIVDWSFSWNFPLR